jgi:hypothetical protein
LLLKQGINLATTYSHKTYRLTTIGAAAFHFRVRNGGPGGSTALWSPEVNLYSKILPYLRL